MKIKLTESQYRKLVLIKEQSEFLDKYNSKMNSLKDTVNRLFTTITYSSLAEFIHGDIDIAVIEQELRKLNDINEAQLKNISDFFDKMPKDEYDKHNWSKHDNNLQRLSYVIFNKIYNLQELLRTIRLTIEDTELIKYFDDVKPTEI